MSLHDILLFDARFLRPWWYVALLLAAVLSIALGALRLVTDTPEGLAGLAIAIAALLVSATRILVGTFQGQTVQVEPSRAIRERAPTVGVSPTDAEAGFVVEGVPVGDAICRSPTADAWLRHHGNEIALIEEKAPARALQRQLRARADDYRRILFSELWRCRKIGKGFFDEPKPCLADDLRPGTRRLAIYRSSYFTSYLLSERVFKNIETLGAEPQPVSLAMHHFDRLTVDGDNRLVPLSVSAISNHIGCNTLAITRDRRMKLWRQSSRARFSEGLLAPTGSGSAIWRDFAHRYRLTDAVIDGMERELLEESTRRGALVNRNMARSTVVLGYFRWIGRGGLPGFSGLTWIDANLRDLQANISEVEDPGRLRTDLDASSEDALGREIRQQLAEEETKISVPLYACYRCLLEVLEDEAGYLEHFLSTAESAARSGPA